MVIVRISGPFGLRDGMLRQILKSDGDSLLQLRIVAFADCLGILVDNHVGVDAVVLDVPLAFGRKEGNARRSYVSTIHQHRDFIDSDESAPGALADQNPELA